MLSTRLYVHRLWEMLYLYRAMLVILRVFELAFVVVRFVMFRAPVLIIWTRLPGLRERTAPWSDLAVMLGPARDRPGLLLHEVCSVTPGDCKTKEELREYFDRVGREVSVPRSTTKTLFGGVIRGTICEMGPSFIKLIQIVSMRPEVPPFVREELQLLQDALPAIPPKEVEKIIDREMRKIGKSKDEVFEWVELKPLAAASLGEVHRAKLRTGQEVAIKVQRPNLEALTTIDTVLIVEVLIERLVKLIQLAKNIDLSIFNISFRGALKREINFYLEGRTQEDYREQFGRLPHFANTIKIAQVYLEYTTDKVLVMELIKGFYRIDRPNDIGVDRFWDLMQVKVPGYPEHFPVHMFRMICALNGDMTMYWGWMHGDPHLGNMYFHEPQDGYDWRIFLCDFGMIEELPPQVQIWQLDMHNAWMWTQDLEQWLWMVLRYFEPRRAFLSRIFCEPYASVQRIVESPCSQKTTNEFKVVKFAPGRFVFDDIIPVLMRRRVSEDSPVEEGDTQYYMQTRRFGGETYSKEVLNLLFVLLPRLVGDFLPPGVFITRTLQHHHFLWWKNQLYTEEISSTLWMGASWNDIWIHGLKERMKERVRYDMQTGNVIHLTDYVEDLVDVFQRPEIMGLLSPDV